MKTGKVAKLFGIDPKTVTGWVDEFAEFFSRSALATNQTQRNYLPEDLVVLNTIKNERAHRTEIETIRAKLAAGYRDNVLPPETSYMDKDSAVAIFGQLKVLQTQLEDQQKENQQLREEIREEREANSRLNREIGKWQGRYEELVERMNRENNQNPDIP